MMDPTQLTLDSIFSDVIVQHKALRDIALSRVPATPERCGRMKEAIRSALELAKEPGSVVRISCDTATDVIIASKILSNLMPFLKEPYLLKEKSTSTQFELSNNSAIMLGIKIKE